MYRLKLRTSTGKWFIMMGVAAGIAAGTRVILARAEHASAGSVKHGCGATGIVATETRFVACRGTE